MTLFKRPPSPQVSPPANAATLRAHLASVSHYRASVQAASLGVALDAVRNIQIARFRSFYNDLLTDHRHTQATHFFLAELYGNQDYSQRDAQFGRIAGAVERLFPENVMVLAVELAEVHALTEELDWLMASAWQDLEVPTDADASTLAHAYTRCWRAVGRQPDRDRQLAAVLQMGWRLAGIVKVPGLRMALRLMRGPAKSAGLSALQSVLENGFDAFQSMGQADTFLNAIASREAKWLTTLFQTPNTAQTQLTRALTRDVLSGTAS
ncbi:MAG TPA: hypothetical protein PK347_02180 [Burkholderiaceae bacterium]|nr:hypothetical protein [Burkholderiaceae bacterium]